MTGNASSRIRNSNSILTALLIAVVVVLALVPLVLIRDSEFGGADEAAKEAILEINPGVKPWFEPLWSPPGSETATLFFSLQAAIGAGVIGYCLGLKRGKSGK